MVASHVNNSMKIICHTHQLVNPLPQLISEKETVNIFTFLFVILMVAWIFGWLVFHLGGAR